MDNTLIEMGAKAMFTVEEQADSDIIQKQRVQGYRQRESTSQNEKSSCYESRQQ